jgi:hypothetical protein
VIVATKRSPGESGLAGSDFALTPVPAWTKLIAMSTAAMRTPASRKKSAISAKRIGDLTLNGINPGDNIKELMT